MAETVRTWNKIGIIGAMDVEVEKLKADMKGVSTAVRAGMEFCEGKLKGKQAVVVRSGIGKVNAAVCTQILADLFSVDCVINTGIAGSLDARIDIGGGLRRPQPAGLSPGADSSDGCVFFPGG